MFSVIEKNGHLVDGLCRLLIDSKEELDSINVNYYPMGTTIYSIADRESYILNGSKEWKGLDDAEDPVVIRPVKVEDLAALEDAFDSEEIKKVILEKDLELDGALVISSETPKTLNLNGRTISCGTNMITVPTGADLTIEGKGEIRGINAVLDVNGGTATINGGSFISETNCGMYSRNSGTINFNNGYLKAQEAGILATEKGIINVNGGELTTVDNFVVGGNGSAGRGDTVININGGLLDGHITSPGYVACGIYQPQSGVLNINGGTIVGNGGCGVCARAGQVNINGGIIRGTGDPELVGKVGDSRVVVGPNAVIYDQTAHYPAVDTLEINVKDGVLSGINDSIQVLTDAGVEAKISVTGGTLTPPFEK